MTSPTDSISFSAGKKEVDPIWDNYLVDRERRQGRRHANKHSYFAKTQALFDRHESEFRVSDERERRTAWVHTVRITSRASLGSKGQASK